jgi:hypothetical protein
MYREEIIEQVAEVVLDRKHRDDDSMLLEVQQTFAHLPAEELQQAEVMLYCLIFMREELDRIEPGRGRAAVRDVRNANRLAGVGARPSGGLFR